MSISEPIRVVELFAGVGGFRLGLERASKLYRTIWANQWEPGRVVQYAYDCYVRHFGKTENHVNKDIATVIGDVPEHDFLVGGFPCQDYSVARTGARGIEGKKGVLWWSINDVLKLRRPKYVLLENVDRLLKSPASQRGRDFGIILRCLHDLGYAVEWRVINAADYGNAQRRRRTLVFAYRSGTQMFEALRAWYRTDVELESWIMGKGLFAHAFPVARIYGGRKTLGSVSRRDFHELTDISNCFKATFYDAGVMYDGRIVSCETTPLGCAPLTLNDVCEKFGVDERYFIAPTALDKWKYLKGAKRIERIRPNGEPYLFTEGAIPFPEKMDTPSRTMLTSESSLNRSTHIISDPKTQRLRLLTPVECERLNGFDDDWTAGIPEKARYFTMGNALVVPLIERIGRTLLSWAPDANVLPFEPIGRFGLRKISREESSKTEDDFAVQLFLNLSERSPIFEIVNQPNVTLFGTYRRACRDWIVANNLYNYPADAQELNLQTTLLKAHKLVLKNPKDKKPMLYFDIIACRPTTKQELANMGYPIRKAGGMKKPYILYSLRPCESFSFTEDDCHQIVLGRGCVRSR